jgi:hypothetical protein
MTEAERKFLEGLTLSTVVACVATLIVGFVAGFVLGYYCHA